MSPTDNTINAKVFYEERIYILIEGDDEHISVNILRCSCFNIYSYKKKMGVYLYTSPCIVSLFLLFDHTLFDMLYV